MNHLGTQCAPHMNQCMFQIFFLKNLHSSVTPVGQPGQPETFFLKKSQFFFFGNFQNFYWPKTFPGTP